jgi:hypothetical protein
MYVNYKRDINFIDPLESACSLVLITKLVCKEVLDAEELSRIISLCRDEFSKSYQKAKEMLASSESWLSREIGSIIDTIAKKNKTKIWLHSCIERFSEWYLYSDKELQNISTLPFMLDQQYHIFDLEKSNSAMSLKEIIDVNKNRILDYLPEMQGLLVSVIDNLAEVMSETDILFKNSIKTSLRSFELLLQEQDISCEYSLPISNKSKPSMYSFPGNNTYIENIFRYTTGMSYKKYLDRKAEYIHIDGNFDYATVNEIKNKGRKTRHVFDTNSQINSVLNKQNMLYKRAFGKRLKTAGTYDQDRAIKDIMTYWEAIDEGVALSLDVSKYSDTMIKHLLEHVLNIIYSSRDIADEISECFNLPILYKGKIHTHIASSQGIYFNFAMITLANIWMQHFISVVSKEKLSACNATGDDVVSIFEKCTKTKEEMANIGRACYAIFNMTINPSKALCSDKLNGEISYLKCHYKIRDGVSYNVSGISPTLYLKSLTSYNSANNVISYLRKSRYIDDDDRESIEEYISLYCSTFRDSIRRAHLYSRVDDDKVKELYDNAEKLFWKRPYIYGGLKNYDLLVRSGREELISDIKSMREYWGKALNEDETSLGLIERICRDSNLSIYDTCIGVDLKAYLNDGFIKVFVKMDEFLSKSKEYIDGDVDLEIEDLKDVRSLLKNLEDKRFDKYKPGGLTTDRSDVCYFEDSFLLDAPSYDNSYSFIPLFPTKFTSVLDRTSTHMAIKMYDCVKTCFYNTNRGNWIINISQEGESDPDKPEKISLIRSYNYPGYTMLSEILQRIEYGCPDAFVKINKIYLQIVSDDKVPEQSKVDLANYIGGDLRRFCSFLEKLSYAAGKEALIREALNQMKEEVTINSARKELKRLVTRKIRKISEETINKMLESTLGR